ncbi:MAG: molybdenum cofactor guanylyltransferase [Bacteroidales bacterium]|nr:molybdenum cofactor guanylyltransferase [Bacteroidales bacterium]MCF8389217.1 molybdenum cofactor guanylyltransferase [Bacteroidales bacterium]
MDKKISGILLAGGKSTRMGEDKAFMNYLGKDLFRYPLEILEQFCDDILISSSNPLFLETRHRIYADDIPGLGPMGGLYTCLKKIKNEYSIVIGCDTPLIDSRLISDLINNIDQHSIIVPLNDKGFPEPLVGIYRKSCSITINKCIENQNYKMSGLLKQEDTLSLELPYPHSELIRLFSNINTKKDFQSLHGDEI